MPNDGTTDPRRPCLQRSSLLRLLWPGIPPEYEPMHFSYHGLYCDPAAWRVETLSSRRNTMRHHPTTKVQRETLDRDRAAMGVRIRAKLQP